MIIQAIPGSGKSHLARARKGYIDSDDILARMDLEGKAGYDAIRKDADKSLRLASLILTHSQAGRTVMCNFDPAEIGLVVDRRYAYAPDDYVPHLELVGKTDLLNGFSLVELKRWASDYLKKDKLTTLSRGQFLSEAIPLRSEVSK